MSEAAEAAKKVYPISVVVNAQVSANKGNWVQFVVRENGDFEIYTSGPFKGDLLDLKNMMETLEHVEEELMEATKLAAHAALKPAANPSTTAKPKAKAKAKK